MSDEIIIKVQGLANRFGDNVVHEGLDLEVRRGEIIGVIGGSGSGKSVLMRAIIGLRAPDEGTVEVFGEDYWSLSPEERAPLERRWGVMFQDGALFTALSVRENV
ncbi:MAG: ATP-binding cassette domain-containing protein, partial [Caulobacterales bacterium]